MLEIREYVLNSNDIKFSIRKLLKLRSIHNFYMTENLIIKKLIEYIQKHMDEIENITTRDIFSKIEYLSLKITISPEESSRFKKFCKVFKLEEHSYEAIKIFNIIYHFDELINQLGSDYVKFKNN